MKPSSELIARACILIAGALELCPVEMLDIKDRTGAKGRRAVVFALAGAYDRGPAWWARHLGFSKTQGSASVYATTAKNSGIMKWAIVREARRMLGLSERYHSPGRVPKVKSEAEAIGNLLKQTPHRTVIPRDNEGAGLAVRNAPTASKQSTADVVTKVDRARLERMKRHMADRPAPKAFKPETATAATPLDLTFLRPIELRIIEKCRRMQKAGDGLNNIKNAINAEFETRKSSDWISRACVTELPRSAA